MILMVMDDDIKHWWRQWLHLTKQKQNSILGRTTACEHQADHNDDTNATNDNHLDNIEDVDDDTDCDIDDMIDNDDEEETESHIPLRGGP